MDKDFFKTSLKHDSRYIKSIWGVFFFLLLLVLLKQKEIVAIKGEWKIKRLNQPSTQDYHNKMIYDSQMGKNTFFS